MQHTFRITIRVRKYSWTEFANEMSYVFRHSIFRLYARMRGVTARFSGLPHSFLTMAVVIPIFLLVGLIGMAYTIGIPIVLFLAAIGRIQ